MEFSNVENVSWQNCIGNYFNNISITITTVEKVFLEKADRILLE
jgi:hypothetical protein